LVRGGRGPVAYGDGVAANRIDTIADLVAAAKYGVKTDGGTAAGPGARVRAEQVRAAYTELERRHTHGTIVLRPRERQEST